MTEFDPKEVEELLGGNGGNKMEKKFTEANYTISFINGQPGLVVRSDSPAEIEEMMKAVLPYFKKFREVVETKSVESGLTAKCETCHAVMTKKSGTSKAGKPWNALFCPNAEKGKPGHDPVWL
jgi:hypothetical protein